MEHRRQLFEKLVALVQPYKNPILSCGFHQLINGTPLIPAIYQDITGGQSLKQTIRSNMYSGDIPVETFRMCVELAKCHETLRLLIPVKDWWAGEMDSLEKEKKRMDYYALKKFSNTFSRILEEYGVPFSILLAPPPAFSYCDNPYFFSETRMQRVFDQRVYDCQLENFCSKEQIPLYDYLYTSGYDILVNFMPFGCKTALMEAQEVALAKFKNFRVQNILCDGTATDFWAETKCFPPL